MLAVKSARVTRRLPKESHQKRKRHHSSLRSFIFHTVYDTFFSAVRVLLVLMESIQPIAEMNKEICHDEFLLLRSWTRKHARKSALNDAIKNRLLAEDGIASRDMASSIDLPQINQNNTMLIQISPHALKGTLSCDIWFVNMCIVT